VQYLNLIVFAVDVTDDDATDKIVSVQVDDEESMIQFIDIPGSEVRCYSVTSLITFAKNVLCN